MKKENCITTCYDFNIDITKITTFVDTALDYYENPSEENEELYGKAVSSLFAELSSDIKDRSIDQARELSIGVGKALFYDNVSSDFRYSMKHGSEIIFDCENRIFFINDEAGKMLFGGEEFFIPKLSSSSVWKKLITGSASDLDSMSSEVYWAIIYHYVYLLFTYELISAFHNTIVKYT